MKNQKLKKLKIAWEGLPIKRNLAGAEAMAAVKQNGYALQYVREQTPEIVLAAVKQNGGALRYADAKFFEEGGDEGQ